MFNLQLLHFNSRPFSRYHGVVRRSLKVLCFQILLSLVVTGCTSSTPLYLQNHFPAMAKPPDALQATLSRSSSDRIPLGLAIVLRPGSYDLTEGGDEAWTQFAASVKNKVERVAPVRMEKVILVNDLSSAENLSLVRQLGRETQTDAILIVFSSGKEVSGPARFDLVHEVSLMNGSQIDHHATIELGLVDVNSGKLFLQVQGQSYATLEKLDTPIKSNRYPRVIGSAMTSYIYPEEGRALEVLRAVAINEALEQAAMKFQEKWPKT